jgi:hypothetical protein
MRNLALHCFLALFLSFPLLAGTQETMLDEALTLVDKASDDAYRFSDFIKQTHGIRILSKAHPFAAMRFNLETQEIEIFQNAFKLSSELIASAIVHEARHLQSDHHEVCLNPSPLAQMEACDEKLPPFHQWREGGSYVHELAFQKRAIELKLPGHEKYIRQFIGNLHIRFTKKPDLELINEWIGPELLESQKYFIKTVRQRYF